MKTVLDNIAVGELYDRYLSKGIAPETIHSGHELIRPDDELKVLSSGGSYKPVKVLTRHKTTKRMVKITCSNGQSVVVTTDHICMAYNSDNMLENTAAKDLKVGAFVKLYNPQSKKELNGSIVDIDVLGPTDEYVYDLELDDESHVYYANDVLVHNSVFLNLQAVDDDFAAKWGVGPDMNTWTDDQKLALWRHVETFVEEQLIPSVQNLVAGLCKTNNSGVLRYGLEYIGSGGIYEAKKHYGVHKIIDEGPELVDKFKFTGIELKKATVPAEIKKFLKDIYCMAIMDGNFGEKEMKSRLDGAFSYVKSASPNEIGQWRGYSTEREMGEGFLQVKKGMTGISKAVGYYNQIAEDMGIVGKYGSINLGDKVQTVYVKPSNRYRIDVIAFKPKAWPKEFDDVFEVDYAKMFEKLVMSPLKNFFLAMKFRESANYNPAAAAELAWNLDDL